MCALRVYIYIYISLYTLFMKDIKYIKKLFKSVHTAPKLARCASAGVAALGSATQETSVALTRVLTLK